MCGRLSIIVTVCALAVAACGDTDSETEQRRFSSYDLRLSDRELFYGALSKHRRLITGDVAEHAGELSVDGHCDGSTRLPEPCLAPRRGGFGRPADAIPRPPPQSGALLIAEGAHPAVIASRLGHTSVTTVLDVYGHLYEGLDRNAADTLGPP